MDNILDSININERNRKIRGKLKSQFPNLSKLIRQLFWFPPFIKGTKIGYEPEIYTRYRKWQHNHSRKRINLCLLTGGTLTRNKKLYFADLHAFWINERSRICKVSVDCAVEKADVIWVFTQDPVTPETLTHLKKELSKAPKNVPIINPPEIYNFYHQKNSFPKLAAAGVRVPRSSFSKNDLGTTLCVYKKIGQGSVPKFRDTYRGPIEGYRTFEFIDYEDGYGDFSRYRAFFMLGLVFPEEVLTAKNWNSCSKTAYDVKYTFQMSPLEIEQIKLIAKVSGLDFFAVDFLRQNPDGNPVFVDINIFPTIFPAVTNPQYLGYWHTFDTPLIQGIPEPLGPPIWKLFDEALVQFIKQNKSQDHRQPHVHDAKAT